MSETAGIQPSPDPSPERLRAEVEALGHWYHTLELAPGVETPGWFDLRPIVGRLPWPEVEGRRCLDVGPYDGFFSFELERRGAAEVVAADIGSPEQWDWPLRLRERGPRALAERAGPSPGAGFELARRALSSAAERVEINVYDLTPERLGRFDVVVCGSLLLHLRDPIAALEAIRGVCDGQFLSCEQIAPELSVPRGRAPAARFRGGEVCQWWIPNPAGHRLMLRAGGFEIERAVRPYAIPLGAGHANRSANVRGPLRKRVLRRLVAGGDGLVHVAALAQPDRSLR